MKNDYIKALKAVWVIYSIIGIVLVSVTEFMPVNFILQSAPVCYSVKHYGKTCFMCGSTRSFIQLAHGNFEQAFALNKFAFILYILIIFNSVFFISFLFKLKQKIK